MLLFSSYNRNNDFQVNRKSFENVRNPLKKMFCYCFKYFYKLATIYPSFLNISTD